MSVGDKLPEHTFLTLSGGEVTPVDTADIFPGKKVVIFGLPGAFTPGCSKTHCPSYVVAADALKGKGVDAIYCTAVNDCFVMDAWLKDQGGEGQIEMLADGDASWAQALGLTKDTGNFGGLRSARYALVAEDGVITHLAVDKEGIKDTTADAIMAHL
eukprot:CAMPEP_0174251222 /NCGR_PEP_ID=MMETSP0439-20130205/1115_1 /TAXON_ID=0 /ORGANISM="Stereomyxa ramosa, Strain Chinc5" /LENGTH=156 /DNA_ID=CAMNT_0015331487 /DNA_START=36 /DNA_END=506 /DNA_ORIENTATION=+